MASASEEESKAAGVSTESLYRSSISKEGQEVNQVGIYMAWAEPIMDYPRNGLVPKDKNEAKRIRFQGAKFSMIKDVSYKRSFTLLLLKCISKEAHYILQEIQEGVGGNHFGLGR